MLRIEAISIPFDQGETFLKRVVADLLDLSPSDFRRFKPVNVAVDARNRRRIVRVFSVEVDFQGETAFLEAAAVAGSRAGALQQRHRIRLATPFVFTVPVVGPVETGDRPVVVGTGPCGLFAGLVLARAGLAPIMLERGQKVEQRVRDVDRFFETGSLNPDSNVQFGEGGAGTFSDGKLYTLVNNPVSDFILAEMVNAGAPPEIATDARPHVGTDKLRRVVKNLRERIVELGGEIHFASPVTGLDIESGAVRGVTVADGRRFAARQLVLAIGHSARDTVTMLHDLGLAMGPKPFSVGLRIEHRRETIDRSQYGDHAGHPLLPAARYKLSTHLASGRGVYTFCMCPGGYVVAAASEAGGVATNGMSLFRQDNTNSNSAILVNVTPADFDGGHPLSGIAFQRTWERRAFALGGSDYAAPIQRVGDFLADRPSTAIGDVRPTYRPGVRLSHLKECLPGFVADALREALPVFGRKIKGFDTPHALLTGVETRSSAPFRIFRDPELQANIRGIYPAGEGAGYAGGIISSALDGVRVAERIIASHTQRVPLPRPY